MRFLRFMIVFLALLTLIGSTTAFAENEKTTKAIITFDDDASSVDVDIGEVVATSDVTLLDSTPSTTSVGNDVCECIGMTANMISGTSGTASRISSMSQFVTSWPTAIPTNASADNITRVVIDWF